VYADMGHAVGRRTRQQGFRRHAGNRLAELLLDQAEELVVADPVEYIF